MQENKYCTEVVVQVYKSLSSLYHSTVIFSPGSKLLYLWQPILKQNLRSSMSTGCKNAHEGLFILALQCVSALHSLHSDCNMATLHSRNKVKCSLAWIVMSFVSKERFWYIGTTAQRYYERTLTPVVNECFPNP